MGGRDPVILERDKELATLAAAIAGTPAGHGTFVLVEGPAGIGKTTLLRTACQRPPAAGARVLTARGLALERDFPYGIVRQLLEPVRAAATPAEWAGLLDGAAGLATRVFDWSADPSVEDDTPHAVTHGLYWLAANLAADGPLVIAVDDAHWADTASLRWLAHLAQRIEDVPVALPAAAAAAADRRRGGRAHPAAVRRQCGRRAVLSLPRQHGRQSVPAGVAGGGAARGGQPAVRPDRPGGDAR